MDNPYLDKYNELVNGPQDCFQQYTGRERLVQDYAWAIPDDVAIKLIAKYGPLVEIGAGRGYWASLISKYTEIVCFDIQPPPNNWCKNTNHIYFKIEKGDASSVLIYPQHTLFLCWPCYENPMAYECLNFYRGRYLCYVGEGNGGCCADEQFWKEIEQNWEEIDSMYIPQYRGIHDYLMVFERIN